MRSDEELEPLIHEPGRPAPGAPLLEKAGLAVFWNAAFLPLKLIVSLGASVVLFRVLNVDDVALYGKVTALLTLLGVLSDLGIERALPRFVPEVEMREGRPGLLKFLRAVGLVRALSLVPFLLLLFVFSGFFGGQLDLGSLEAEDLPPGFSIAETQSFLLWIVAVLLVLGAASDISYQVLYTYFRQKVTNLIDVFNALLLPTLRSVLIIALGVLGAIYGLLIATILSVVVSLGLMGRALRQEPIAKSKSSATPPDERSFWRRFTSMALLMQVITMSAMLYDRPVVVWMATLLIADQQRENQVVALALLCFAFVGQMLRALVTPMSGIQTPLFSRLYAENRIEGLRTAYASLTKFLILVLFPAGVGLIIMSRNILMLLFGQVRQEQVLTAQTLPVVIISTAILIVGLFGEAIISVAMNVLVVYEKHRVVLLARLVALISIPLFVLLIPPFGMIGAAFAVASSALASRLVALLYAQRLLQLPFPTRFLGRVAGATLAFMVVVAPLAGMLPVQPTSVAPVEALTLAVANGLLVIAAVAIFLVVFRRLGGIDPSDKRRFAGMRIPGIKLALRYL